MTPTTDRAPLAYLYDTYGGPEVLYLSEVNAALPAPGQVLISVKAVGLNPVDAKLRSGLIGEPADPWPRGVASDLSGVVESVGGAVMYHDGTPIQTGDEVLGWAEHQSLREQVIVPAGQLTLKPAGLTWEYAAALMTAGLTAQKSLQKLRLGARDTVLVSAAAGGVGAIFSQLARRAGAKVVDTASESTMLFSDRTV